MSAANYLNTGKQEGHPSADTFFRVSPSASPRPPPSSHLPGSAFAPPPQGSATNSGGTIDVPGVSRFAQGYGAAQSQHSVMPSHNSVALSSGNFMQNAQASGQQGGGSLNTPVSEYQNQPAAPQGPLLQRKRTKSAPRQGAILTGKQEHCRSTFHHESTMQCLTPSRSQARTLVPTNPV